MYWGGAVGAGLAGGSGVTDLGSGGGPGGGGAPPAGGGGHGGFLFGGLTVAPLSSGRRRREHSMTTGIGSHHRPYRGDSDDWLTPPEIIDALSPFDLDPCASVSQPWPTATAMWTERGLDREWSGFVWCNPPYGPATGRWLRRLADHGNGIALVFARTETRMAFAEVWSRATGVLLIEGRLHFHYPVSGDRATANAGGPSMLVAYGDTAVARIEESGIRGLWVPLAECSLIGEAVEQMELMA